MRVKLSECMEEVEEMEARRRTLYGKVEEEEGRLRERKDIYRRLKSEFDAVMLEVGDM